MTLCLRYVHVPLLPYISSFIDCFFLVASPKCFRMRLCCSWTATLHRSSGCTPGWLQPFRFTNKSYCFSDLWSTPPVQNQKSTGSISWRCDWITAIWGFWLWFRIGMWHTSPHFIFNCCLKKTFFSGQRESWHQDEVGVWSTRMDLERLWTTATVSALSTPGDGNGWGKRLETRWKCQTSSRITLALWSFKGAQCSCPPGNVQGCGKGRSIYPGKHQCSPVISHRILGKQGHPR